MRNTVRRIACYSLLGVAAHLISPGAARAQKLLPEGPWAVGSSVGYHLALPARADTTHQPDGSAVVRLYFGSGQQQEEIPYGNLRQRTLDGVFRRWYESGQLFTEEEYRAGQRHGRLAAYRPDGRLSRLEHYAQGELLDATCFDSMGKKVFWSEFFLPPVYQINTAEEQIIRLTRYPPAARQQGIKGVVHIGCIVNQRGQLSQARVVASPSPLLNGEALRVAGLLTRWQPGKLDGQPAVVEYVIRVPFVRP